MDEELDEYGIPIKKTEQPSTHDEYGIPLKKKDVTESALPSSNVSGEPGQQPDQNLESNTSTLAQRINKDVFAKPTPKKENPFKELSPKEESPEQVRDVAARKIIEDQSVKDFSIGKQKEKEPFVETLSKGAIGVVKDLIPQAFYQTSAAGVRTTPFTEKDLTDEKSIKYAANDLFQKKVAEGKYMEALRIGDDEAKAYIQEQIGKPKEFQEKQIKEKQQLFKEADKQRDEFNRYTRDMVTSLDDIKSPSDVAGYIAYNVGQSIPQIGMSLLSGGMSSYVMEYGEVYDSQVRKIAEDKGISVDDVIKQGLDDPEAGQAAGALAGALDRVGVEAIFKNFGKDALKNILRVSSKYQAAKQIGKAALKSGAAEGITEGAQYVVEETGSSLGAGRGIKQSVSDIEGKKLLESTVAGVVSGGILGGAGQSTSTSDVIENVSTNVAIDDMQALDKAAEAIIENKVEPKQETNAIQEPSTSSVLQHPQTGVGEAGSGRGGVEPSQQGQAPPQESNQGKAQEVAPIVKAEPKVGDEVSFKYQGKIIDGVVDSIKGDRVNVKNENITYPVKSENVYEKGNAQSRQNVGESNEPSGMESGRGKNESGKSSGSSATQSSEVPASEAGIGTDSQPQTGRSVGIEPSESNRGDVEGETNGKGLEPQDETVSGTEQSPVDTEPEYIPSQQPEQPASPAKTYAIAQRILDSDTNEAIKRGVKQKGADYIPKKIDVTDKEAKDLIELYGEDRTEALVRDAKNDLTGDTRTALAAKLYERYKIQADAATDNGTKQKLYDRAVDIALTSAEQLKEAGRQTNAAKIWKAITSSEDMTVLAMEKETAKQAKKLIEPIQGKIDVAREQFDEQIRKLIAQKVTEGVEANLKRAKLITTEKRKQINDAFDKLKIKTDPNKLNNIFQVVGEGVYNGSIEAVKRAVLAGADVANAVQAGIDYIRDNYKGTDFDEEAYQKQFSPVVENMIPKEKISTSDIDANKISTPKLSDKKKKDFISQVVDAHNEGKLTDEMFDSLYAKQLGAKELTSEDRQQIRKLAKIVSDVEKFEEQVKNDFTKENIDKYYKTLKEAQVANEKLNEYARQPSDVWSTLISIMQGNLLTPLSLVTNIYSNIALQPLRFTSTAIGGVIDYSISQVAKTGLLAESYKNKTIDLTALQSGYFKGGWNGTLEGLKQLKSGPRADDRNLREINSQFSAVKAISRWADGNRNMNQKVNDYIEGTLGVPAEVMFRLLNLGDKPFKRAAELARTMELASLKKLTGKDLGKFIMFPDAESAVEIKKAGEEATFQQDSKSAKLIQDVLNKVLKYVGEIPLVGGPLKVLLKSQVPYVKTPWNIITETMQYAAFPVTGMVGMAQIHKGNKRNGSILIGKALVGAMIYAVAKQLFSLGLLSWDEPYDKKSGKQTERKSMQFENIPPNALNVSAVQRGMLGDGFEIQDGDAWIDYSKLGIIGLLFDNYSNNYFSNIREKGQMPEESEFYVDMLTTAPRVMSQALDQSFLKGTSQLLTAIQSGGGYETEKWLISTTGSLASIIYPNTISTISKSSDEFIRDTRDPSFVQQLQNTYKTKLFMGDQLPAKVSLWGDKVTGNPEGRNKFAYYLFDPTKFKEVDTDNFRYKLYEAWKEDKFNDDWLPSAPKRDITLKKVDIKLTPAEYEVLATSVGKERANLVTTYINSPSFKNASKENKIKRLEELYKDGSERGKKKFLMNTGLGMKTQQALKKIAEERKK